MSGPRPDQRHTPGRGGTGGSRSGAGDTAGALGYPGISAAVPNLLGASLFQQNVSQPTIVTLPGAGRVWEVILSYAITSNASYAASTSRTVAAVSTGTAGLVLATIQLAVANPNQHDSASLAVAYPGLPLTGGDSLHLNVNNGTVITNLDQQASVSVLYSVP
jgi:hypothetical protein